MKGCVLALLALGNSLTAYADATHSQIQQRQNGGRPPVTAYLSCCVCLYDPSDLSHKGGYGTDKECTVQLAKKSCEKKFEPVSVDRYQKFQPTGVQCKNVDVFNAYHGSSNMVEVPYAIAATVAKALNPKCVEMDGSTCLMSDNNEQADQCARLLGAANPKCKFKIRANQNIGVVSNRTTDEFQDESSKATRKIHGDKVKTSYDRCTSTGGSCGFADPKKDAHLFKQSTNDPNVKTCKTGLFGQLTTQTCCGVYEPNAKKMVGFWSAPGRGCR